MAGQITDWKLLTCNLQQDMPTPAVLQCLMHVQAACVPEPVDANLFDPAGVNPLDLLMGWLVFGRSEAQPVAFLLVSCCWIASTCCLPAFIYFL